MHRCVRDFVSFAHAPLYHCTLREHPTTSGHTPPFSTYFFIFRGNNPIHININIQTYYYIIPCCPNYDVPIFHLSINLHLVISAKNLRTSWWIPPMLHGLVEKGDPRKTPRVRHHDPSTKNGEKRGVHPIVRHQFSGQIYVNVIYHHFNSHLSHHLTVVYRSNMYWTILIWCMELS